MKHRFLQILRAICVYNPGHGCIYPLSSFVVQANQSSLGRESNLAPLIASLGLVLGLDIDGYAWHGELNLDPHIGVQSFKHILTRFSDDAS